MGNSIFWRVLAIVVVVLVVIGWSYDRIENNKVVWANRVVSNIKAQYNREITKANAIISNYEKQLDAKKNKK